MTTPLFVFDDDCGFCTWWAEYFDEHSDITIVGFSAMDEAVRARLSDDYEDCAHLVTDTRVYSCGEAVEEAFVRSDVGEPFQSISNFLRQSAWYANLREMGYEYVAGNRPQFSSIVSSLSSSADE